MKISNVIYLSALDDAFCKSVRAVLEEEGACASVIEVSEEEISTIDLSGAGRRAAVIASASTAVKEAFAPYIKASTVVLSKEDDLSFLYRQGARRFIFDISDRRQILLALARLSEEGADDRSRRLGLQEARERSGKDSWKDAEHDFNFKDGEYYFKGRRIFLAKSEAEYIASRLLLYRWRVEDRQLLCRMRRRYGEGFLSAEVLRNA